MSNKVSKTTISGSAPQWSDEQFNHRLRVRLHAYDNTSECTETVSRPLEHEWLQLVTEKVNEGWTLDRRWPITHAELRHSVQMRKPQSVQDVEKEVIKAQVKADYVAHLQASLAEYKAQLAQQLLEAAEAKERKKEEDAASKRLLAAQKEADDCFGKLDIPDGFPACATGQSDLARFSLECEEEHV